MKVGAIDRFVGSARAIGLEPDVHRFPEGTKTAEDAARAIGCDVAQIVKSLVFMADGRPVLALTSGRNRVDTVRLAALVGAADVRRATPDEAKAATGFSVGGTPPLALSHLRSGAARGGTAPGTTLVDETLLAYDEVWAAAGTPDAVFPIAPSDLVDVSGGTVAAFSEPSRPESGG